MENKNTLIGTILLGILVAGMFFYQSKIDKATPEKEKETTAAIDKDTTKVADAVIPASTQIEAIDTTVPTRDPINYTLENQQLKVTFSDRGGNATSVNLKEYTTWDKKPLILFTEKSNHFGYIATIAGKKTATAQLLFDAKATENSIEFSYAAPTGEQIVQTYTLPKEGYKLDYTLKINGITQPLSLDWHSELLNLEHSVSTERTYSALYYKFKDGDVKHLDETKDDESTKAEKPLEWISYKQQFFNATLVTKGIISNVALSTKHDKDKLNYVKNYTADGTFAKAKDGIYKMEWIFSPNKFKSLKTQADDLQEIVKLSPDFAVFKWIKYITQFFTIPIFNVLEKTGLNYGIIILILTIVLKLLLTPLTWSSIKSSAFMKVLKPEIDELKVKYGDDQQKISSEQMKIYQTAGVNPFGGCLPMLLQLPILMSMYYFFPNSIELRQQPFLWASDLSSYDAIYTFKETIFGQNHISLFTILMTVTSIAMAVYTQANSGMTNTQPGMQYLPYIMPLFLMVMFNSFPAALTYYYLLQNVISMGQQWAIQKFFIDEAAIHKKIQDNKKNPKAPSKLSQKLAEIQKQQEETRKKK